MMTRSDDPLTLTPADDPADDRLTELLLQSGFMLALLGDMNRQLLQVSDDLTRLIPPRP